MKVSNLYRIKRGNQNQTIGLIVNGSSASIQILGSSAKPTALSEMVDLTDSETLSEGSYSFSMLPEYVYFSGTADRVDIVNASSEDLSTTLE